MQDFTTVKTLSLGTRHGPPRPSVPFIPLLPFEPSGRQYFFRTLNALGIVKLGCNNFTQTVHHVLVFFLQFGLSYRDGLLPLRGFHFLQLAIEGVAHDPRGQNAKQDKGDAGLEQQVAFPL